MTDKSYVSEVPETEALSQAVIYGVAELNGVDPLDLDERLYDCIDPDALDRLFTTGGCGSLQFTMAGCHVDVSADRRVSVSRIHEDATTAEARV